MTTKRRTFAMFSARLDYTCLLPVETEYSRRFSVTASSLSFLFVKRNQTTRDGFKFWFSSSDADRSKMNFDLQTNWDEMRLWLKPHLKSHFLVLLSRSRDLFVFLDLFQVIFVQTFTLLFFFSPSFWTLIRTGVINQCCLTDNYLNVYYMPFY